MPVDRKISSSPEHPQPLHTIAQAVRSWVERLGEVWVEAQVIELNRHRSWYVYVTLRDLTEEVSVQASCPVAVLDVAGPLTANATVVTRVKPRYWLKNGRLSYELLEIRPSGEGRLLAHLEQLKRMLQAEGLFDPVRKKRLPFLPRRIGLVTGADSAAAAGRGSGGRTTMGAPHGRRPGARAARGAPGLQHPRQRRWRKRANFDHLQLAARWPGL